MTNITEDQVQARVDQAVREATAALETELAQVRESQDAAAQDAAIAAAREPLEARVAELETQCELLTNEVAAAATRWTEAETLLNEAAAEQARQDEIDERRDTRAAAIREVAFFGDDYYTEERLDNWAAMEQAAFDDLLAQMTETAAAAGHVRTEVTAPSAFTASDGPAKGGRRRTARLSAAMALRNSGVDLRRV